MRCIFMFATLVVISVFIVSDFQKTDAIGPYPCFYQMLRFEKSEYNPGETITIRAEHCNPQTHDNATLYILDSKVNIYDSQTLSEIIAGKHSVYQETKSPVNGVVEFSYKIPQSNPFHQYMVLISPGAMGGLDNGYFFTKENASQIVLSDLKILNQPKQGENLRFEVKATDGAGEPIPILDLQVKARYVDCANNEMDLNNDIPVLEFGQYEKEQYFSRGMFWGWLPIPQGKPGTYELELSADTFSAIHTPNGWQHSDTKKIKFDVLDEPANDNKVRILIDTYYPEHFNYVDFADIGFTDSWYATTQIVTNSCKNQQTSIPLKIDLLKSEMNRQAVFDKLGRNSLDYGDEISCYKMPETCSMKTIGEKEITVGSNQYVGIPEGFLKPIRQTPGEYMLKATTIIDGVPIEKTVGIRTHNIKSYDILTDEGNSYVRVDSWYSGPVNVSFDKENKKLTVDVQTKDPMKRIEIFVPHNLLAGDYVAFVDGVKQTLDENTIKKYSGQTLFSLIGKNENMHIEIIGTSAIPEFGPVSDLILVVSLIAVVMIFRTRFRKNM